MICNRYTWPVMCLRFRVSVAPDPATARESLPGVDATDDGCRELRVVQRSHWTARVLDGKGNPCFSHQLYYRDFLQIFPSTHSKGENHTALDGHENSWWVHAGSDVDIMLPLVIHRGCSNALGNVAGTILE